jgi:hypothetical protein
VKCHLFVTSSSFAMLCSIILCYVPIFCLMLSLFKISYNNQNPLPVKCIVRVVFRWYGSKLNSIEIRYKFWRRNIRTLMNTFMYYRHRRNKSSQLLWKENLIKTWLFFNLFAKCGTPIEAQRKPYIFVFLISFEHNKPADPQTLNSHVHPITGIHHEDRANNDNTFIRIYSSTNLQRKINTNSQITNLSN